ncbi:virion structural protein and packaging [Cyanophage S-TIM5]|uniref:Virion structural protein and packaging n=1 Tax=Cyanophage S-TIM5 TaxID=1137745 RepID=H6WFY5_9CAUD|nr:virion structural protein and packaging [Cyanophage S-TIM5]AEZ65710.1 virion structural protein and packaging [Cyanophage S-TIM5]UYE96877.1 virion structural protein [Cyanophage S-TIM66]UYE97089.1 virion structural protein [Cyanophage S-TIM61]
MTSPKKITQFTAATEVADNDVILFVDTSDTSSSAEGTTKKTTVSAVETNIRAGLNINNWNTAYGWGDHASEGYLTSYTETDPVFTAHPANGITSTIIGQWNTAYGWGNHATQGYLQSIATQNIGSLNDVSINSGTLATNQVLKWNGTSWINGTGGGGGGGTTINELNDVGDVNITSVANDQILRYDASAEEWRNEDLSVTFTETDTLATVTGRGNTTSADIQFGSNKAKFGTNAFEIYHNGSNGYIDNATGELYIRDTNATGTNRIFIQPKTGENGIIAYEDGQVELYHDNQKKFETTSNGVEVTGVAVADSFNIANNNATIAGTTGANRDIKVIGGAPYYYDGTAWREFYLIDGSVTTLQPDTDWGNVMIRSTFDSNINDVKYNVTPAMVKSFNSTSTAIDIVQAPVKVGVGAVRINGGAEAMSRLEYDVSNHTNYSFTGAWTMEAWVKLDSTSFTATYQSIFSASASNSNDDFSLMVSNNNTGYSSVSWYNEANTSHSSQNGTFIGSISTNSITNAYAHVALVRDPGDAKIRFYFNGTKVGNDITDNEIQQPDVFNLGGHYGNNYNRSFDGYFDDLRISKSARYTANFTPSTTQLPVSGSTTQVVTRPQIIQGEIDLGSSPTWTGTSGVTVSQQSSGTYRLTFATAYSAITDYIVFAQAMDQSAPAYVQADRATGRVDFEIKSQSANAAVNDGSIAVQVFNKMV